MKTYLVKLICPKCKELEYRTITHFMNVWVVRCKKCDNMFDANEAYKILGEVIKITQNIVYRDDVGTDQIIEVDKL